jgi:membrane-associated phospholipid phosphatase
MPRTSIRSLLAVGLALAAWMPASLAHAQPPPDEHPVDEKVPAAADPTPTTSGAAATSPEPTDTRQTVPVSAEHSKERASTAEPKAVHPPPKKITFTADPITDGGIILASTAFAGVLEMINGTGEIRPQQISPDFDRSRLLLLDRSAVSQTPDPNAKTYSNIGLFSVVAFAAIDPVLSAVREKHVQTGIVDAIIYAEAVAITLGVTNLAKIAVRRPRPQAYIDFDRNRSDPNYSNSVTDSALSFFSGHASVTGTVTAVATYLAFARSSNLLRPLLTLAVGTAITTFVSVERVRGAAHFPTDVIAGAVAGGGIGTIVAHVHRSEDVKQRRVWVGFVPERDPAGHGGVLQIGGVF